MRACYNELEDGSLTSCLSIAKEILEMCKSQSEKPEQNILRTVATYAVAVTNLTVRAPLTDEEGKAKYSLFVSTLPLHPRHQVIAVRMAIKDNFAIGNYETCSNLISKLLPLKLFDHDSLLEKLAQCQDKKNKVSLDLESLESNYEQFVEKSCSF